MLSLHEKSYPPHNLHLSLLSNLSVENSNCTCKAGCGNCNHILGLMYLSCHYKKLEWKTVPSIISKTSIPQRLHGVNPEAVEDIQVQEFQIQTADALSKHHLQFNKTVRTFKFTTLLPITIDVIKIVESKVGPVPKGSIFSYQQKKMWKTNRINNHQ